MTGRVMWRTLSMVELASASPRPRGRTAVRPAVFASLAMHVLLLLLAARGRVAAGEPVVAAPVLANTASDVWVGDTSLPGAGRLVDIDTQPGSAGRGATPSGAAAAAAPAPSPEPAPASESQPPPEPAPPARPAPAPEPAASAEPAPSPRPAPSVTSTPFPSAAAPSARPARPAARAPKPRPSAEPGDALTRALEGGSRAATRGVDAAQEPAAAASAEASAGAAPGGGSFGAAGEAKGVRDLGRAFTRAIPPAVSNDPMWRRLPTGPAGRYDVIVSVDETGRITGHHSSDRDPPKHLVRLVDKTLRLLESGTYALGGQVGAGTQALSVSVTLADEPPNAGDETGGLNLAFEYDGQRGKASFTQPGGRRVEVAIRVEQRTRAR